MFSRLENIKLGNLDEEGASLNDVEETLAKVNIRLRENETTFRPMADVIEDVAKKWSTLNDIEKMSISQAIAGTRQRENLIVLFENFSQSLRLQEVSANSAGTALDRYRIYQENVEASSNRLTATWEELWSKSIDPRAIIFFNNLATSLLNLMNEAGGLTPVILAVVSAFTYFNGTQIAAAFMGLIAKIGASISALITMGATATATGTAVSAAFGIIGLAVSAAIIAYNVFNETAEETRQRLDNIHGEVETLSSSLKKLNSDTGRIGDLWEEFEELDSKTKRTNKEQQRWLELQGEIKDLIPKVNGQYDDMGNFILDASVNLKKLNDLKKEEIELTREMLALKQEEEIKELAKAYKKQLEEMQNLAKLYEGMKNSPYRATEFDAVSENPELRDTEKKMKEQSLLTKQFVNELKQSYELLNRDAKTDFLEYLSTLGKFGEDVAKELTTVESTWKRSVDGMMESSMDLVKTMEETYQGLSGTLKKLQDESSMLFDLSDKELNGSLSYDDVTKLLEANKENIKLLEIENGLVQLNTDAVRKKTIEDADAAVKLAKKNDASKEEIAILENYLGWVERAIPLSRDYVDNFQNLMNQTGDLMGGEKMPEQMKNLNDSVMGLNETFKSGKINVQEYFDGLNEQLEATNLTEVFGENDEAATTFFSGLVLNATEALPQVMSMFNAGEITIMEFIDSLSSIGGTFETLIGMVGTFGESFGLTAEEATAFQSSMGGVVESLIGSIGELNSMQELNKQIMLTNIDVTTNGLRQGTAEYQAHMQAVAEAYFAINQSYTDSMGNMYTSADSLAKHLGASTNNFQTFTQKTAKMLEIVIEKVVHNIGTSMRKVAAEMKRFSFKISVTPKPGKKIPFPIEAFGKELSFLKVPSFDLDIGTGNIANVVDSAGAALEKWDVDLGNDIYNAPVDNPVTDKAENLGNAYKDLKDTLDDVKNAAKDAANEQKKLADELLKKIKRVKDAEKDALKEKLSNYKKLIDAQKKELDQKEKEKDFEEEVEEQQKGILDLKNELAELALDDSEEAEARRKQLEEELAKLEQKLEETQREESIDDQKKALDDEYELFKEKIDKEISAIEDFLEQLASIEAKTIEELIKKLEDIGITINVESGTIETHHQGSMSGFVGGKSLSREGEVFSKLLKGEVVANQADFERFFNKTLPSLMSIPSFTSNMGGGGEMNIENLIRIDGNATADIIPNLEKIANQVIDKLNNAMTNKGFVRKANNFGG
jgi:hypothetical protein